MRLPTRNAEGIRQLVSLLAPDTTATIISPDPVKIQVAQRSDLRASRRVALSQRATLGKTGKEACSRILLVLATNSQQEAADWLPGGQLHADLKVLLRVYLGYRSDVRLRLTVPVSALPEPRLGHKCRIQLGRTGVLGLKGDRSGKRHPFDRQPWLLRQGWTVSRFLWHWMAVIASISTTLHSGRNHFMITVFPAAGRSARVLWPACWLRAGTDSHRWHHQRDQIHFLQKNKDTASRL
ncbi:Uncharacterized protein conserved in bacteria [Raoultella terrigena]|uniref:Uncharacterized protein conserved in bacteria n=1 Tax=Raoultella terrigena TaxID=577 RepID=A0A3P8IWU4_RAOTE|nr:Uncharacterized protein conserved in bacteria [Raoultella terrigena]